VDSLKASFVFSDGVSLGPGHCRVIIQPSVDSLTEEEDISSVLLEWSSESAMTVLDVNYPLTRIVQSHEQQSQLFVAGRLGFIGVINGDIIGEETIEGPQTRGFIRDLRVIGQHVYATGMGRQVYRRFGPGNWSPFDDGIVNTPTDYLDVTGFNAIDGVSEEHIYAVGFGGEIWRCLRGQWRQVSSPTNLILERVRTLGPDLVYAAGQAGVLLRGHDDVWQSIDQTATNDDFWGLEWFHGHLYLSTDKGLFRLNEHSELDSIDLGLPGPRTYSQLHANNGALWSFGSNHLSWTEDGETWNDVTMQ
jgi:hypothetical protein